MNKHPHRNAMTFAALRDLDPVPTTILTDAERERADAMFARILATTSRDPGLERTGRAGPRLTRLLVPAGLMFAAAAAVPALLLGGNSAFASWTSTPGPLTGVAAAEAATACRAALAVTDRGERVAIAERRGGWTYLLLVGPDSEATCLMPEGLTDQEDQAADAREGFMGSYASDPGEAPVLARSGIIGYGSASSVPTGGLWGFREAEEWVTDVDGYVGSDVTGVTVHAPIGTDVEASVANGRFAAWWPSVKPSSENPEVMGAWTYTVTLADGTSRQVAGP